jgi:hypothetical protein
LLPIAPLLLESDTQSCHRFTATNALFYFGTTIRTVPAPLQNRQRSPSMTLPEPGTQAGDLEFNVAGVRHFTPSFLHDFGTVILARPRSLKAIGSTPQH